jgi:PAS domain
MPTIGGRPAPLTYINAPFPPSAERTKADVMIDQTPVPSLSALVVAARLGFDWRSRGRGSLALPEPAPEDIDPVELRLWLGRVHLWEQLDDGDFRCRIWGTQISEMTGSIRDGTRASTMWPSPYGATVFGQYQRTMGSRQPTLHRMTFTFLGHSWTYDRVSLPLAPSRHTPPMLLNYTSLGDRHAWRRLWNELEKIADGNWTRTHRAR